MFFIEDPIFRTILARQPYEFHTKFFEQQKDHGDMLIDRVLLRPPATIVFWHDGTKTVSRCEDDDTYSPEVGFLTCIAKKCYGNQLFRELMERYVWSHEEYLDSQERNLPNPAPESLFDKSVEVKMP